MTAALWDAEGNLWFRIDPYDFDTADMGADLDEEDDPFPDPVMDPVPRAFVRRLRELSPTWRELGLTYDLTSGLYDNGRAWVLVPVSDRTANLSLGHLRVDITESEWTGSWVRGGNPTDPKLELAEPMGEPVRESISDPQPGIERAVQWLVEQFSRPLTRREWRKGDQLVAKSWTFDDTGTAVIASGEQKYWSRPETADETVRVRPPEQST